MPPRRGTLLPVVVMSLLVVLGVMALVLNQMWINTAYAELQGAVDASALAAANGLVNDDLLRPKTKRSDRLEAARNSAVRVAAQNRIAGQPLLLNTALDGDLRFGRVVADRTGKRVFLDTTSNPLAVFVQGHRTQDRTNPLGLLLTEAAGRQAVDLTAQAEASVENGVVAIRASAAFNAPALPLAILQSDPTGKQTITWETQIVQRLGLDNYGFDATKNTVVRKPDGIPEIELVGENPNACLIDIGTNLNAKQLVRQIQHGWATADLANREGELVCPSVLKTSTTFSRSLCEALRDVRGRPRIVVLFVAAENSADIQCAGFAAGRVMDVVTKPNAAPRIVFQPAVMTTRAVVLNTERPGTTATPNPYLYKVRLTK
jgi:hypothetical protein